jgi:RNA polymerase sigma-70 factor (ECF subfamily)
MRKEEDKLALYLAHRTALVDYATPIVGCRARAEDVVQESYVRFVRRPSPGAEVHTPIAYLYRVVRNLALDCLRHMSLEGPPLSDEAMQHIPSASATPEGEALYRDQLRVLGDALQELPARTRRAFELHRLHGHTQQQIAAELDISVGLVNLLIDDALTHCAERLGKRKKLP